MRVLALAVLLLAGAAADPDAPVRELIEGGKIAQAESRVPTDIDADRLQALAEAFYGAGTKEGVDAAERLFARALALREARAQDEPLPLASLLHDLSGLNFNAGRLGRAEDAERRALALRERALGPSSPLTAESRRDLGLIFLAQGRLSEAATMLPPALEVIESSHPPPEEVAAGRNYLAELYRLQGRYDEAAGVLESLVRRPGADADPQFAYYLNNLAGVYRDQGRFDEAEGLLRRSLALREVADPRNDGAVARATLNLAELMRVQEKPADAAPLYARARDLARRALGDDSPDLFEFVNQPAVLDRDQGRLREAESGFRQALGLVEKGLGPDHPRVAQCLLDLGDTLRKAGRCGEAAPLLALAVAIRERVFGPEHPDVAEGLVASALCGAGPAARTALDRAIAVLGRSEAHPEAAAEAYARRADLRKASDPAGARADLDQALKAVEAMRPHRGGGEDVRADFLGRYAGLYERAARWEVEAGHPDRALAVVERGRTRALLDQLAVARVARAAPPPDLKARRDAAQAELAEVRERMLFEQARTDLPPREKVARLAALETRREAAARGFRAVYDEARNASPAWRAAVAGPPATAAEIRARVAPRGGWLLEYEIGGAGSLVFPVSASSPVAALDLRVPPAEAEVLGVAPGPLTRETLERVLAGSDGLLARVGAPRGATARGIGGLTADAGPGLSTARLHALWRILVPPALWVRVAGAAEVLVIPDGTLSFLPFEMLVTAPGRDPASTRYWLDDGPVVRYAPSATLLRDLAARTPSARAAGALSVSDPAFASLPQLPGTAAETAEVRAALGGAVEVTVLGGTQASESAVRKALPGKRYIHLATHGLDDRLALAAPGPGPRKGEDDGSLDLFEIYDLRVDAELAVLSACSTNTGRLVEGEGAFALSRGFLVAGARRVVASQWPVDDDSTAALVGGLFRRLAREDAATALRDAKREVRNRPEWADPFHWAPFVLTGP